MHKKVAKEALPAKQALLVASLSQGNICHHGGSAVGAVLIYPRAVERGESESPLTESKSGQFNVGTSSLADASDQRICN